MAGMSDDTLSCPITYTCFVLRTLTQRDYRILSERGNVGAVAEFRKCRGQRPRLQARFGSAITSCVPKKATTKNWNYVRDNPIRAGLAQSADEWPFAGEIEALRF